MGQDEDKALQVPHGPKSQPQHSEVVRLSSTPFHLGAIWENHPEAPLGIHQSGLQTGEGEAHL